MIMMEKYQNQLEDLVNERTTELREEKRRTENLLQRMLPVYVFFFLSRILSIFLRKLFHSYFVRKIILTNLQFSLKVEFSQRKNEMSNFIHLLTLYYYFLFKGLIVLPIYCKILLKYHRF